MTIDFVIPGEPPRVTAQEKRIRIVNGKPRFYKPKELVEAENVYYWAAKNAMPKGWEPLTGPLYLSVDFCFGTDKKKLWNTYKTTRPDLDNMVKSLKDSMTRAGIWVDDSNVAMCSTTKWWVSHETAGIHVCVNTIHDTNEEMNE